MSEVVYYSDDAVQVTGEWVKLGDKTYRISDITAAQVSWGSAYRYRWLMIVVALAWVAVWAVRLLLPEVGSTIPAFLSTLLLLAWFGLVLLGMRRTYRVWLMGSFGKVDVFSSRDRAYIQKIVDAINASVRKLDPGDPNWWSTPR